MNQVVAIKSPVAERPHSRSVSLPNGTLRLDWLEHGWRLDDLCTFAARNNPRRGFLIVSRVLGRHLPARPSAVRAASDALALRVPTDLPGPVLFIGMAETAITLGKAVHGAWCRQTGRDDALYLHSTRQQIGREPLLRFSELHSHASAHLLYAPDLPHWPHDLASIKSLVLVDDEVTTGNTFVNLVARLAPHLPALERVEVAVLTDWTGDDDFLSALPADAQCRALLEGRLSWQGEPCEGGPPPACTGKLGTLDQRRNLGRLGSTDQHFDFSEISQRAAQGGPQALHVIGTGELHYPALLLGELLEAQGHDVLLQATTRSPARLGAAITAIAQLEDNYGTGVANFLYNADQTAARRRIVCHETPVQALDPALLRPQDLGALDCGAPA